MKTILAVLNNPYESKKFIKYLLQLGVETKQAVHFIYVDSMPEYPSMSTGFVGSAIINYNAHFKKIKKEIEQKIDLMINDISFKLNKRLKTKLSIEKGNKVNTIVNYTKQDDIEMAVLEMEEHEDIWTSKAHNLDIVQNVSKPVLIIPKNANYSVFHDIIYTTNYNAKDVNVLKNLIDFTPDESPDIYAIHLTNKVDFEEEIKHEGFVNMLKEKTNYKKIQLTSIEEHPNQEAAHLINNYAIENKADLIVLLREDKNFFERLFKSTPTRELIHETVFPVMVYSE